MPGWDFDITALRARKAWGKVLNNIVVEGAVGVVYEVPSLEGDEQQRQDVLFSAVGPGGTFAWSALVPPHKATASTKALSPCWLVSFDRKKLIETRANVCLRDGTVVAESTSKQFVINTEPGHGGKSKEPNIDA